MIDKYALFFLRSNEHFPEGALFELADTTQPSLPDRGDGEAVLIDMERLIRCPEFAENVPPGQCPVAVTSVSKGDLNNVTIDQTLHYQVVEIPFAVEISQVLSATVNDRLHGLEVERYESSIVDRKYRLHIGHLRPGFYEAICELPDSEQLLITFIKFFPKQFTDRYAEIAQNEQLRRNGNDARRVPIPSIAIAPHHRGDVFSDELLNYALKLTTEWGENYGKPIKERILRLFPELSDQEIDALTKISREAEYYIYDLAAQELDGKINEHDIVPFARGKFTWLDRENSSRLANIGMFYARK